MGKFLFKYICFHGCHRFSICFYHIIIQTYIGVILFQALSNIGDPNLFFSPDDSISLSLEYYQQKTEETESETNNSESTEKDNKSDEVNSAVSNETKDTVTKELLPVTGTITGDSGDTDNSGIYRRYLQCPAAVTMAHIMKFLRMKYALTEEHRVSVSLYSIFDTEIFIKN